MKKTKKPPTPQWSTTVHPSEYDYYGQFSEMVKRANQNRECFCEMDVGKVWGLVLAYKEMKESNETIEQLKDELAHYKNAAKYGDIYLP